MILRYLYYLTYMTSGTDAWKGCYDAWQKLSTFISAEEYEKILKDLMEFNKKYVFKI